MVFIQNVNTFTLDSLDEARNIYSKGINTRKVSSTKMNEASSRSHMIYTLVIQSFNNETK